MMRSFYFPGLGLAFTVLAMVCQLLHAAPPGEAEAKPEQPAKATKWRPLSPPKRVAPFSIQKGQSATPLSRSFAKEPAFVDEFGTDWTSTQKSWRIATWKQNETMMSPERCRVNDAGMMVQTVLPELPGKGGSMQTNREFGYGRWVARVRPSAVAGVLNSVFTKDWDDLTTATPENDGGQSEVDIEFLTHTFQPGAGEVHLAIHLKGYSPYWEENVPLDFNPSDDLYDWGFDILPDRVIWHVDGRKLGEWIYTPEHRVDPSYEFFFNSWTMKKWIKGPPTEKTEYLIDWVKFYSYQPGS